MWNYWKILICVVITFLILAGCKEKDTSYYRSPEPAETPQRAVEAQLRDSTNKVVATKALDPQIARVVGRVYHLANPLFDPSTLKAYVQENKTLFVENSPVIRCAKVLGTNLFNRSIQSFGQDDYDRAYGSALEMGATGEQARDVANSMQSGSLDLFVMGQELFWLSQVLPSAANGDWRPFETTGTQTRQQLRQALPFLKEMLAQDPAMNGIVEAVGQQYLPIVEDQIVWLAIMTGVCK